ncbi:MAG: hypothetical protein AAFX87_07325 [Bacteroidota bacterium]
MKKILLMLASFGFSLGMVNATNPTESADKLELKRVKSGEAQFLFYKAYSGKKTMTLPAQGLERIKIRTGAGLVRVQAAEGSEIEVEAEVTLAAKNKEAAAAFVDKFMNLYLAGKDSTAILVSRFYFEERNNFSQAFNPNGFFTSPVRKIDLIVKVPAHLAVSIVDRSGDLIIKDLKNDVSVTDHSGDLVIKNVEGNLKVRDYSGDLRLSNINTENGAGKVISISDNSGAIRVNGIGGAVSIRDASGDVDIRKIQGNLSVRDASGGLYIENIAGDIKVVDASGDIVTEDVQGSVTLHDASGGIYVNGVSENVHVKNAGTGDLRIKNSKGKISGDLRRMYR